jgi:uncharacterized membrane protein
LEPLLVLGAVPDLAINLLSNQSHQTTLQYQYTAGILPFLVVATIFGAARFKRRRIELSLWVLACAAALAVFSPLSSVVGDVRALGSPLAAARAHAVDLIPAGVPLSASNQLAGHLSERRHIYLFPLVGESRWIAVDANDTTYIDTVGYRRVIRKYEAGKQWRTVFSSHGVVVLHKR